MKHRDRLGDRSVATFLLGLTLFSPPLLAIFSSRMMIFGIPLLYFYLFAAWAGLICLIALNSRGGAAARRQVGEDE